MHRGIRERWLLTGLLALLAGCATVPAEPRPERATADAQFPTPGTRWITRSVDQTGRTWTTTWNVLEEGSYQGEPAYRVSDQLSTLVYGLQRAFLYAGTPAVVTTLWKVDDRASFLLMREFYDQLKTRGPAEALRRAQSATIAEFSHPFFWAAFTITGMPQ